MKFIVFRVIKVSIINFSLNFFTELTRLFSTLEFYSLLITLRNVLAKVNR